MGNTNQEAAEALVSATIPNSIPTLAQEISSLQARLSKETPEEREHREQRLNKEHEREQARAVNIRIAEAAAGAGLRYNPSRISLDTFITTHPAQKSVVEFLRSLDLVKLVEGGMGLLFYGPVGTGKDHLAMAMLYKAMRELPLVKIEGEPFTKPLFGKWIDGQEWFGTIRDRISEERSEREMFRDLAKPAILVISDPIPARRDPSPFNIEMLFRLVDRRYRDMKSTWLTVNAGSPDEAADRLSQPVFDRLRELAVMVKCFWPSYRERKA